MNIFAPLKFHAPYIPGNDCINIERRRLNGMKRKTVPGIILNKASVYTKRIDPPGEHKKVHVPGELAPCMFPHISRLELKDVGLPFILYDAVNEAMEGDPAFMGDTEFFLELDLACPGEKGQYNSVVPEHLVDAPSMLHTTSHRLCVGVLARILLDEPLGTCG